MLATLQRDLQKKYKWLKEIRVYSTTPESTDDQEKPQLLRVQIIVSSYKPRQQPMLLAELSEWAKQQKVELEPLFLTEKEALQFSVFDSSETLSPVELLRYYKKQEDFPQNAKKQFKRAMDEILRLLRGLEQEFPTSGLHAWNVGLRLEALYHQVVAWGLALFEREYTKSEDDWNFFLAQFRHEHPKLSKASFANYPLQLQAFLQRHQKLAALVPKTYGDNDLELEALLLPLEYALKAVRKVGIEQFSTQQEKERGVKIAWWSAMTLSVLCVVGLLFVAYNTEGQYRKAAKLPSNAKIGGVTGSYYKGRKFEKFRRTRTDRVIAMEWKRSPAPGLPADHFSVRWKGFVQAPIDGLYRFCGRYDDGAKMWISSQLIVDDWHGGAKRTRCKKLYLQKGWHKLKIEFFEHSGPASIRLQWQRPTDKHLRTIPSKHLCCRK